MIQKVGKGKGKGKGKDDSGEDKDKKAKEDEFDWNKLLKNVDDLEAMIQEEDIVPIHRIMPKDFADYKSLQAFTAVIKCNMYGMYVLFH